MNNVNKRQSGMNTSVPLVSISCLTYQHAHYIAKAIDGFLMQKTTFSIEILIHDDASTDNTANIIREYEAKYPEIIKPIYETENQWLKGKRGSAIFNFPRARGKYIALCEGDDYWTDPYKLQKQVDFLENNPEFVMSFHRVKVLRGSEFFDDYITKERIPKGRDTFDTYDLSFGNFIHTVSVVFRNVKGAYVDNKVLIKSSIGDYVLYLYLSLHGKIKLLNDCMGVYRVHAGGIWSEKNYEYTHTKIKQYLELLIDNFTHPSKQNLINRYYYTILESIKINLRKGRFLLVMT